MLYAHSHWDGWNRRQQQECKHKLYELEEKSAELESVIQEAKLVTATDNESREESEAETELSTTHCVTCRHERDVKTAMKHMEKCFTKMESLTSYGSFYKTKIDGSAMICDAYNPASKTYCKRLKFMCPEHTKEPKMTADESCGCPLTK